MNLNKLAVKQEIGKPQFFYIYEVAYFTAQVTNNFTVAISWKNSNAVKQIINELDNDRISFEKHLKSISFDSIKLDKAKRAERLLAVANPVIDIAKEYWNSDTQSKFTFVNDIKRYLNSETINRCNIQLLAWAIYKANYEKKLKDDGLIKDTDNINTESKNSFNKIYNLIMEEINSNNSSDPYSRMKWMFNRWLRILPKEQADELVKKSVEDALMYFKNAYNNNLVLDDIIRNNSYNLDDFKVTKIDDYVVSYTAKYDNSLTSVDIRTGVILPHKTIEFIKDTCYEIMNQKHEAEKKEAKLKYDNEISSFNISEYKVFKQELDKKFPDVIEKYCKFNKNIDDNFFEFIKGQPDEIKVGLENELKHTSFENPNIEYIDGPDYYKERTKNIEIEERKNKLIDKIKNL